MSPVDQVVDNNNFSALDLADDVIEIQYVYDVEQAYKLLQDRLVFKCLVVGCFNVIG